jgi:hypothetical protein
MTLKREADAQAAKQEAERVAAEAAEARAAAEAAAARTKAETEAAVAHMKAKTAAYEAANAAAMKQAEQEAAEAKAERERLAQAAREADEAEHQAEMAARRVKDKEQAERHQREMAERKAAFEKVFRNVWGVGATATSQVLMLSKDDKTSKKVIRDLFSDTLVADIEAHSNHIRTYKNETKLNDIKTDLHFHNDQILLEGVTQDDRIAEFIEVATKAEGSDKMPLLVVPLHQASKEYLEWITTQTMEFDTSDAHYDDDPFANHAPVAHEEIAGMKDFQ